MTIKSLLPMTLAALLAIGTFAATAQETTDRAGIPDPQQEEPEPSDKGD